MEEDRFRKEVIERLDMLIRLAAIDSVKEKPLVDSISFLSEMGFGTLEIARILGKSSNYVSRVKWENKKNKTSKSVKELEFHSDDLLDVLTNPTLFGSNSDLASFTVGILSEAIGYSENEPRSVFVKHVIDLFNKSDKRKQALFIQALERRATQKELKDTQFLKFLEGWEAHIRGN